MQMCCDRTRLGFPPLSVLLCYGGGGDCGGGGAATSRLESTRASLRLRAALRLPTQPALTGSPPPPWQAGVGEGLYW